MSDISIVTLVKNRTAHLDRLLDGVQRSITAPREIVIVDMSDTPVAPRLLDIPMFIVPMAATGLPLAAARNRGAEASSGRHLLFLDVDCIPRSDLVGIIDEALFGNDHLICAEVRYLGPNIQDFTNEDALTQASLGHPHRSFPCQGWRLEDNAGLFWSLLFAIRHNTFRSLRGFDESYEGYGAEDTDFGFRARRVGLPLAFLGGTGAFHQYHGVIDPPLQHIADIVRNANRFHRIWRLWPMQDWLAAFEAQGLIARKGETIRLLRLPTPDEIARATQPPTVYF